MSQDNKQLGLWKNDDFAETVATHSGKGNDAGHTTSTRFLREVHKLVTRRQAVASELESDGMAVFLLKSSFSKDACGVEFHEEYALDDGLRRLTSRLWMVTPAVIKGSYTDISAFTGNQLIEWISGHLGCGDVPAIIYNPSALGRQIRFYGNGVADVENCTKHSVGATDITPERIEAVVNSTYRQRLLRPGSLSGLWVDGFPSSRAESMIQETLINYLGGHFLGFHIYSEQTSESGRLDILLEEPFTSPVQCNVMHAVLELKVLRSHTVSGSPKPKLSYKKIVVEGVKQAIAYKDDRNSRIGALYCFDMRIAKERSDCFGSALCLAEYYDIKLGQWVLYSSASESRHARY
ncbi:MULTISPECIES: hypothetical protein [Pseudodesulfovibrio]|uniref:Uncharacterized protein n=1 Tax=Pseudodesulfovibrio aespoeensis (strain ATCC 700646 / DSM 10631 / Aspo-2) TaxID=643562 RepID=E6VVH8_PSEA9|nr:MULTISPECIES: hypothetical protein [Pseudodesulfovibrio]ADU63536.1 protein of unknown function DUF1703 [Pseudodesulfovibrio aespoeensis Aspo-2]MBV1765602.1 hypothetical protein [Pseudodesulfovibrio sp.]MCG2734000.1 hypothetical protein [Pseudodesulfovibrio aespoeensis]